MIKVIAGPKGSGKVALALATEETIKYTVITYDDLVTREFALSDLIAKCYDVAIIKDVPWKAYALNFIRMIAATDKITCDFPGRRSEPKAVPKIIICVETDKPLQEEPGFTIITIDNSVSN